VLTLDSDWCYQIMLNLIDNVLRYSEGYIELIVLVSVADLIFIFYWYNRIATQGSLALMEQWKFGCRYHERKLTVDGIRFSGCAHTRSSLSPLHF
jgi:hypothetical protein